MGNIPLRRGSETITPTASQVYMGQTLYTKAELKLMNKYLQAFARTERSTPNDLRHMLYHWEELNQVHQHPADQTTGVAPIMQLFDVFYSYLFQFAPELQPLFHNSAQFHGRALMNIVGGIRNLLMSPNVLETAAGIAQRHVMYGVKCEYFNAFGQALMKSLQILAPTLWTPQVSKAWHSVYTHVAVLVLTRLSQELRPKRGYSMSSTTVAALSKSNHQPSAVDVSASPSSRTGVPVRRLSDPREFLGSPDEFGQDLMEPSGRGGGAVSRPSSSPSRHKSDLGASSGKLILLESSPGTRHASSTSPMASQQVDEQAGQETPC